MRFHSREWWAQVVDHSQPVGEGSAIACAGGVESTEVDRDLVAVAPLEAAVEGGDPAEVEDLGHDPGRQPAVVLGAEVLDEVLAGSLLGVLHAAQPLLVSAMPAPGEWLVEAGVQVGRVEMGVGAAAAEDLSDLDACGDLDALEGIEQVQLQSAVKVVKADDLVEAGAR